MKIYKKIISFLVIILTMITAYPTQSKTEVLIDFNNYEKENKKSLATQSTIKKEEAFRTQFYNKDKTLKNEADFFLPKTKENIPKFNITSQDMSLNKWIINYKSQDHQIIETKLTLKNTNTKESINKIIKENDYLNAHIHFPYNSKYASIKAPFEIYPYNKKGQIINIGNGVIQNIGKINRITMKIATTKGNFKDISILLKLKNESNYIESYSMGFLHLNENNKNLRYFKQKDEQSFLQEIKKQDIKQNMSYYKVYYKNNDIYRWQLIQKTKIIYQELTLEWINPDYSNRKNDIKQYEKKEIYPNTIPLIKFQEILLKQYTNNKVKNFHILFKNIEVFYDKKIKDAYIELYKNDDKIWNIVNKINKEKRQIIEIRNAKTLLNKFEKGRKQGFLKYDTFKEYFRDLP